MRPCENHRQNSHVAKFAFSLVLDRPNHSLYYPWLTKLYELPVGCSIPGKIDNFLTVRTCFYVPYIEAVSPDSNAQSVKFPGYVGETTISHYPPLTNVRCAAPGTKKRPN